MKTIGQYPKGTQIKIPIKLLASQNKAYNKNVILLNKSAFILEMQRWFNIHILINIIKHISFDDRNHTVSIAAEKAFDKNQDDLMIKFLERIENIF